MGNLEKDKEELNFKALEEETYLKTIIYGQQAHSEELGKKAQMKYDDDKIEELTSVSITKKKQENLKRGFKCTISVTALFFSGLLNYKYN